MLRNTNSVSSCRCCTRRKMSSTTTDETSGATTLSAVHPDIIQAHILKCLDGPSLASISTTCSQFRALSDHEHLWSNICDATWPSTNTPRVLQVISTFPRASRSFFADSFPVNARASRRRADIDRAPEFISSVDLFHRGRPILSKVVETETESSWFRCSPFRVDLLDPKDAVTTAMEYPRSDGACEALGEDLTLSWIVIDPKGKRAVNVSSVKAMSVERHWLSGEVKVKFATVVDGGERGSASEVALCCVAVTFGGEMQVREACLQVEDMDGTYLNGRDSLGILLRGLEGKRGKWREEKEGKERYVEFVNRKRERREMKVMAERRLDMLCVSLAVLSFVAISTLLIF
ncbi:hypothetical protein RJT34_19583 [Clitoria ternatea]|uniref:F-box domain-containing protein n=1 Tax=Clitoria ternatea TaxID=43366 RepID=A0AAN9IRA3_CLITE